LIRKIKTTFATFELNHLMHFRLHMVRNNVYKAQDLGLMM